MKKNQTAVPFESGDESESIAIGKTERGHIIDKLLILFLKLTF